MVVIKVNNGNQSTSGGLSLYQVDCAQRRSVSRDQAVAGAGRPSLASTAFSSDPG
jgi:hypothetical protein